MKTFKLTLLSLLASAFILTSCSKKDDNTENPKDASGKFSVKISENETLITGQVENLFAGEGVEHGDPSKGVFTKFDFSDGIGKITESETEWDIAFKATTIIFNGGTKVIEKGANEPERNGNAAGYITDAFMKDFTKVDTALLKQDSKQGWVIPVGSGNGWYTYSMQTHIVSAAPKKTIIVRTRDGKHYLKMEILTYYKDYNESGKDMDLARYYSFNYQYQTIENSTTLSSSSASFLD